MNGLSDQQLLRDYTGGQSEAAFAELVRRHVDLVYSAAARMVRDAQLAEDVTQSAFVALARNAGQLTDCAVLSGWLHRTAQNIAAQTVRTDVRRRAREQEAAAMNELFAAESDAPWEQIAPHLDAALGELSEPDRDALLLRYFERKSAREMAQTLGISDEAAQKRVNRAVDRLREFIAKRGVTVGASGLVLVIAANAVQAAPAGLAVTISAAAALAGSSLVAATTTVTVTQAIAMTTLQKAVIATTLTIAIGAGIYAARQAALQRTEVRTLRQQGTPLAQQLRQLQREHADAANRLAAAAQENARLKSDRAAAELRKMRGEVTQLRSAATDPAAAPIKSSLVKVNLLKQRLEQTPGARIPEFQFLTEEDWLSAVKGNLSTETDYRRAFGALRNSAEERFLQRLRVPLSEYVQVNHGEFPADLAQLQPYFKSPVEDALLQRWQIAPAELYPHLQVGSKRVITQKAAVDEDYDARIVLGPNNTAWGEFKVQRAIQTLLPVYQAYLAGHRDNDHLMNASGQIDPTLLNPYIQTPEQQAALEAVIARMSSAQK